MPRGQTLTPVWYSVLPWDLPHMPKEKPCKKSWKFHHLPLESQKKLIKVIVEYILRWNLGEHSMEINTFSRPSQTYLLNHTLHGIPGFYGSLPPLYHSVLVPQVSCWFIPNVPNIVPCELQAPQTWLNQWIKWTNMSASTGDGKYHHPGCKNLERIQRLMILDKQIDALSWQFELRMIHCWGREVWIRRNFHALIWNQM